MSSMPTTAPTRDPLASARDPLYASLKRHVGRYAAKKFDWDAFPANRGYRELMRGQMRYVGAGGSPKIDDLATLPPEHFTVSLIHQPVGTYAAAHSHEVEEAFLVLGGVLTVGWGKDGDVVEIGLGPKDMILNAEGIAHGFRNEGVEPVLMSIMVGAARPLAPVYHAHPKDVGPEAAARFGGTPGRIFAFDADSDHPLNRLMKQHVVRYSALQPRWDDAGIARMVYVGDGGIPSRNTRKELVTVPKGCAIRPYARAVEETYFMIEGALTVGWQKDGATIEERLGPKDLVFSPAGQMHYFRNDGVSDAQFFMVVGSPEPDRIVFERL